jgi:integrase
VAGYSSQQLLDMSRLQLSNLAKGLVPNASRLNKTQLIEELLTATEVERAILATEARSKLANEEVAQDFIEDVNQDLGGFSQSLYETFKDLALESYKPDGSWKQSIHADISSLAYRVISWLNSRPGEQLDGGLDFTTKLRYRTHICNLFGEFVEGERQSVYYPQLASCLDLFKRQVKLQIAELTIMKKGLQERRVAQRKKQKAVISFKPLHEFALRWLGNLDKLKPRDWRQISIALAIATGRRMAEIHCSAKFEYVDETHLMFTGQLKVKGLAAEYFASNPSYKIPVLVPARLAIAGHQWLIDNGKISPTPQRASNRLAPELRKAMLLLKKTLGIEHDFFTYKGLRSIYALVCNQVFNGSDPDNTLYLAEILGHGRADLLYGNEISDMVTPQSYNADFVVIDWEEANKQG